MCNKKLLKPIHKISDPLGLAEKAGLPTSLDLVPDEPKVATDPVSPPDSAPTEVDSAILEARDNERRRRASAAGRSSTILTGAGGLSDPASTGQKTLLGA